MITFLIIALVVAVLIIWGLATHNNNVDEQVRVRSENEKKRLEELYSKLSREKELEFQKKYAEIQNLHNARERAYKELHDRLKGEYQTKFEQNSLDYKKKCQEVESRYQARIVDLDQKQQKSITLYNTYTKELSKIDDIIKQKLELYPHLAAVMADLLTAHFDYSAKYLREKPHPAHTEAFRINQLKKETKKIIEEKKLLEYQIAYIRKVIPNIDDIFDSGFIDHELPFEAETEENTDRVRFYLEPEEYQKLSSVERNQLALDRYISGRKSKWQIGRDYEMYIGYLYEKKGCTVEYMGIIKGLEDLGRDLIVKNNGKTSIIQCKNWSKEKTIHEKHIFQLFGTVVLYNIEHPQANAKGIFISTTTLSQTALQVAKELDIRVVQKDHGEFPRIKCNINRSTGEWIYHLPFDQQYDSARIDKTQGEFYALTVAEAETNGFRRAFRHFG